MLHQDFYTGEPTILGSPISSAEQEAAQMASFGKYDYNSGSRNLIPQPMFNQGNQNFQSQTIGIGAPYVNNQFNQYWNGYGNFSPYGNVMPNRQMFNQQIYQPPQPTSYHIPGFNPGGNEFLPNTNWEDEVNNLQMDYWVAKQEVDVSNEMKMQQSIYGGYNQWGFNYYGMPYYNPYVYNNLDSEFSQKINKIKDEARNNRVQLNMKLLKLSHNMLGNEVSDEEIERRCTGYDIPIPQTAVQDTQTFYQQVRLSNMVEVSNAKFYSDARAKRQRELDALIPPDSNMKEAFDGLGLLAAELELEEEKHRRKDLGRNYSSDNNVYKYYVKKKARERYAAEHGSMQNMRPENQFNNVFGKQIINQFPTLSQNATIADDGTLNVSLSLPVNVGSHAGETYTISNANEAEYEKKREQFGKFLGSIKTNGEPYLEDLKRKKFEEYVPI